ncbi:MAG TPA: hypothetical protein ENI07_03555 [Desulfobacterales bacterium]|nr:hypothetical protein [Desulfobacterales bacterium]
MPDWLAPFHMPKFNDEDFLKKKAEYISRYGYTVTIPALSDIFKFGRVKEMSLQEWKDWKNKDWENFSADRLAELTKEKQHKKDRMMAMLGSPTPEVFSKLGAILTALDDAQDAISTMAAVARLTRKIAPKLLGKLFMGPVGWLLTVNDILNLLTGLGQTVAFMGFAKKYKDTVTASNPFTKKARAKRARKLRSWKPTLADFIQAAQTTEQVFGVGVSLGPITGLVQDVFHATVRMSTGVPVRFKLSPHFVPQWLTTAYMVMKTSSPWIAVQKGTPDDDFLSIFLAQAFAHESIFPWQQDWNPLEQVEDLQHVEIRCPIPTHPLTLSIMEDEGIEIEDVIGWPIIDKEWASPDELVDVYGPLVQQNVHSFFERHNHDSMGCLAASLVTDTAMYQIANMEGEDQIEYDYTAASKMATSLLLGNKYPAPWQEQKPGVTDIMIRYLEYYESIGEPMGYREFITVANRYGYKLLDFA